MFRPKAFSAKVWPAALAAALGTGMPAVAAEEDTGMQASAPADMSPDRDEIAGGRPQQGEVKIAANQTAGAEAVEKPRTEPAAGSSAETPPKNQFAGTRNLGQMATFTLPSTAARGTSGGPPRPVTQFLQYQYSYGSESDVTYRRDTDLNQNLRDNSLVLAPQVNGYLLYRPNNAMEFMLEMMLEQEIAAQEEAVVTLPNGETVAAQNRSTSLMVDQAWMRFKTVGPFDVTLGRRNFEDDRHWLYDTSLDAIFARTRQNDFIVELTAARKDKWNLDLIRNAPKGEIDNYMLYVDYRGIEDIRLAGYTIYSYDNSGQEGKPLHFGLRAYGMPSDKFNFWSELAFLRGKDELQRNFSAYAVDVGGTYRHTEHPLRPSITLGYAYGSGDGNPDDNVNHEFRQTGLHSNEVKAAGVSKFKYYGEVLDPDLSNIGIFTAGFGFRPAQSIFVDLVYHQYRLNEIADEIRNWALTAQMNQVDTDLSKDVGKALDIVVGFRNVFGIRRFGIDLRAGWFFPGKAFLRNDGTDETPDIRDADKGISVLAKLWW